MNMGWPTVNLGDVCDLQNGFAFKSKSFKESGTPVLRISSIQGEEVSDNRPIYVDENDYSENLSKYYVSQGDLLIAMSGGTTGKIGFLKTGDRYLLNQRVGLFRTTKKLDKQYLFYFLLTKSEESLKISAGSAQPNLSTKQIKSFQIPLPPVEEQKRIVAIFDEAFAGIDTAIANTEKNLANARELFESYLNSVFARKGGDWVESTFNDVCLKIQDGAHHSPKILSGEKFDGSYLYLTSKNIRTNYMSLSKLQYTNAEFHNSIYPRCNPEYGDILLTKDGANTGNICLNTLREPFSLLSSVCLIKTNDEIISSSFLKYYIQSQNGFKQITGKMTGAAIKRIILRTIKAAVVPYPPREKQNEIVSELDGLLSKSQELEAIYQQKLNSLKELKQSLLQKAFSGELTAAKATTEAILKEEEIA